MAETTLNTRIQLRRDSEANWSSINPVLALAELGVNTDNGKMKLGDGVKTWSELPYLSNENDVAPFTHYEGTSIEEAVGDNVPQEGDICVVKVLIADDKYSYTSYVFDEGVWKAMDGNYNAKNVYFDSDFVFTEKVGTVTIPATGSTTVTADGKNIQEFLAGIFAQAKAPTITQPSLSATGNATPSSAEVGSTITKFNWNGSFSKGSYSYGSKIGDTVYTDTGTGIGNATWAISNSVDSQTATTEDGSFTITPITIDTVGSNTYGTISWSGTYGDSPRTPVNNIGAEVEGKIVGATKSGTINMNVTGIRNCFYGSAVTPIELTSANIRALAGKTANPANSLTVTVVEGANQVVIAVPATRKITKVEDTGAFGTDIVGSFTSTVVSVEGANGFTGANYNVYVYAPSAALGANTYKVTVANV